MDGYSEIRDTYNKDNLELDNFETNQTEPINSLKNVNYNTNGDTGYGHGSYNNQETEFGVDGGFNVTNTVPKFHNERDMDCWFLTWKNFEQIKSISAGLNFTITFKSDLRRNFIHFHFIIWILQDYYFCFAVVYIPFGQFIKYYFFIYTNTF